jgi:hypothetical protein
VQRVFFSRVFVLFPVSHGNSIFHLLIQYFFVCLDLETPFWALSVSFKLCFALFFLWHVVELCRVEVDMTCTPVRSPSDFDWPAGQAKCSSPVRERIETQAKIAACFVAGALRFRLQAHVVFVFTS